MVAVGGGGADAVVVVVDGTLVAVVDVVDGGTVVGGTVVVVAGRVVGGKVVGGTVVVVVEGATTEPLPQQLMEAFQCFHPPFAYTSHAATAVLAEGS